MEIFKNTICSRPNIVFAPVTSGSEFCNYQGYPQMFKTSQQLKQKQLTVRGIGKAKGIFNFKFLILNYGIGKADEI
jgi:hypothetical protein